MTTPLTSEQAIALLREQPAAYDTPDKLRALAAQVDADAVGRVTVLYSGPSAKGVSSSQIIRSMLESGEDIRVIDKSEAAKLLQSREFLHSVAKAYGLDDFRPLADGTYRGPAADWLYHPTQGPWADASARFADATIGEVRAIVGDANPNRVFGATEVPHILANEKVPTVEGIPREALVTRQSTHGTQAAFEMIVARSREHVGLLRVASDVPVNYAGELLRDERGQLKLDSRDYFAATNLDSKVPAFSSETRALSGSMNQPSEYARAGQLHLHELQTQSVPVRGPRPGAGVAAKGLGAAAVAATAYDIADTAHDVDRLRAQGNAAAAEDRVTRFAAQNLGGWGGAAAGFAAGAAAGVESGPGLLVTGAVGGVIGAVAGDQVATWIRDYKINHQDDRQGNTWTFDPDHPERGWTRDDGSLIDQALGRSRTLTADAKLSDELTYKASSRSIDLALGAPPQNRDPYRLPVDAADVTQRQPFETGRAWIRDPQTGHWQQEITEMVDGRVPVTRHEPVRPEQAEVLEQRSQTIIARNAAQTPAAMAAQFQTAYERNGWAQHGPLPAAVSKALRHPGQVVASDGDLYERNAQGQWTHDGTLWDSEANGVLRQELEATYQAQQGLRVTTLEPVVVRPDPDLKQVQPAPASRTASPRRPDDPDHPDHALLDKLQDRVRELDQQAGKGWDEHSERLAASALVMAKKMGFTEKDDLHLAFNRPTDKYAAGEILHLARTGAHASADPAANRIHMPAAEALSKPAEERYQQAHDIVAQQQEQERQQALARGAEDPSRGAWVR